jgi:hypothetical protein
MFDGNAVVHVVAPTGMAAFNVLGERFAGLDWKNMKKEMAKRDSGDLSEGALHLYATHQQKCIQ